LNKLDVKTPEEIKTMADGGERLAEVREMLRGAVKAGVTAAEIEKMAVENIKRLGGKPSFTTVPGYHWATCVNINDGVVHGIPKPSIKFKKGDLVSVDVGMYYNGFHTDTSFSVVVGQNKELERFLEIGKEALNKAIKSAKIGNTIGDISAAFDSVFDKYENITAIHSLTGHGVGRELHEDPYVPCYVSGTEHEAIKIVEGMTLAIEIMYAKGSGKVKVESDGWTISTRDAKIAALFEETVAVSSHGPIILTRYDKNSKHKS